MTDITDDFVIDSSLERESKYTRDWQTDRLILMLRQHI